MKNISIALAILLFPALSFAGDSQIHPNYVWSGGFQAYMSSDQASGTQQRFNIKVHPDRLAFISVTTASGQSALCSIKGNGTLAEDMYDAISHMKDGSQLTVYHDRSTDSYTGVCTGFKFVTDTRFQTVR